MDTSLKNSGKAGFGLMEVLASMVILALTFSAVMYLQYSNREAALRIQTRNEATQIGQRYIDSLSAQGLAQVKDIVADTVWGATRDLASGTTTRRRYIVDVDVIDDTVSYGAQLSDTIVQYTYTASKRLDVTIRWDLRGSTKTIRLAGVVQ